MKISYYLYVVIPSRGFHKRINIYKLGDNNRPVFVKEIRFNTASTRGAVHEVYTAITGKGGYFSQGDDNMFIDDLYVG